MKIDNFLLPHYIGEKALAIPNKEGEVVLSKKLVNKEGRIPNVSKELKLLQKEWIEDGGIINEICCLNSQEIKNFIKIESERYINQLKNNFEISSDIPNELNKLRELLHKTLGQKFAMEIVPRSNNPKDIINSQKRTFLPEEEIIIDRDFSFILNEIKEIKVLNEKEPLLRKITEILKKYQIYTKANLCGIVFNNGKCITSFSKENPIFLKVYEKRMAYNKSKLDDGLLGTSFDFSQFIGENGGAVANAHI